MLSYAKAGALQPVSQTLLLAADAQCSVLAGYLFGHLDRACYSPYGTRVTSRQQQARMAFNGQLREPQGWYHLGNGHRAYNPLLRRFHSADRLSPFGKGGLNAYAYCLGDPLNFTDPSGQIAEFWEFLKAVFYEVPTANLVLSSGLLLLNLVTAITLPPTTTLSYFGLRTGLAGATLGMIGSTAQMAGARDAGRAISIVGTIFSGISVLSRVTLGVQKLQQEWPTIKKDLWPRFRNIFVGGYRKPLPSLRGASPPIESIAMEPLSSASLVRSPALSASRALSRSTVDLGPGPMESITRRWSLPASLS